MIYLFFIFVALLAGNGKLALLFLCLLPIIALGEHIEEKRGRD